MSEFLSAMTAEMGARRRRLRESLGDRGQSLFECLVLGGLVIGSVGLLLGPWMAGAAPWGFALPFVFIGGFLLLETRRQTAVKAGAEPAAIAVGYDWAVVIFGLACALAGIAAFVIAWGAAPVEPPPPPEWAPPESSVTVDMTP